MERKTISNRLWLILADLYDEIEEAHRKAVKDLGELSNDVPATDHLATQGLKEAKGLIDGVEPSQTNLLAMLSFGMEKEPEAA